MDPANPMADLMQGLLNGSLWDLPMVNGMIFPSPAARDMAHAGGAGPTRDGRLPTRDGAAQLGYRLYLPAAPPTIVVLHFHGNAEVCGDADDLAAVFVAEGAALLSIDYRGYGWSTGAPRVSALCGDAEAALDAVVAGEVPGLPAGPKVACWGRSIGALSAVHLAAYRPAVVRGVFVDSGLMSIAALPMVRQAAGAMLGPSAGETLDRITDPAAAPFGATTLQKARTVGCPALVLHGDRDEIVPGQQGARCHEALGSADKVWVNCPGAGHNDVLVGHAATWRASATAWLGKAAAFDATHPARATVETHGLSAAKFNGKTGVVLAPARVDAGAPARASVKFDDAAMGTKAIKLENLTVVAREPFLLGGA